MIVKKGPFQIKQESRCGNLITTFTVSIDTNNADKKLGFAPYGLDSSRVEILVGNHCHVKPYLSQIKDGLVQIKKFLKSRKYNEVVQEYDNNEDEEEDDGNGSKTKTRKYVLVAFEGQSWTKLKIERTSLKPLCDLIEYAFVD